MTALAAVCAACGGGKGATTWSLPNADLAGTRDAPGAKIDAANVARLTVRWRFRFTPAPSFSGIFASTPVTDGSEVYVQDLRSNVYALDRASGRVRWTRRFDAKNDGPNGVAVAGGRVYGSTDSDAFALDAATGRQLWLRHLTGVEEQFVDVAPVPWHDLILLSTIGYAPRGRGAMVALDSKTGAVRWKFDTIRDPWRHVGAGGGGLWNPVSVDGDGRVYGGNSNPDPWGGTPQFPNGGLFPGAVPYTDSLLVLEGKSGRLLWHDQVTPHDVRDYDFQVSPVLVNTLVIGAGKAGLVVAWDRASHRRIWTARVGLHRNDTGPLPRRRVIVCPGLLGGVETSLAVADGRVFVPVVDLCAHGSATAYDDVTKEDPAKGRGRLVALDVTTGRRLWERRFPSPDFGCATAANDVIFTTTFDGTLYALRASDGVTLWSTRLRAGSNACPAVVGDELLVGAGVRLGSGSVPELVAFGLGGG
ncbi:MAG: outer membrane protein assembly factor BamB family protein [Gaiellaceae bacterium]